MEHSQDLYNLIEKVKTMHLEEQVRMSPEELENELGQIIIHAVFIFARDKDLRNFDLDDFLQEVSLRVLMNKKRNTFIEYIKKGDSRAVWTYISKICRTVFRDEVQKRNIRMNTEFLVGDSVKMDYIKNTDIYQLGRNLWTEYNFRDRIKGIKMGSHEYNKIVAMCSELQHESLDKLIKGEEMTNREKNSILKLKDKVLSYQLL